MADYQLQSSKFHKEQAIDAAGVLYPQDGHKLYGERSLHVFIQNATPQNSVIVQGRLSGSNENGWVDLGTINGSGHFPFIDIANYDYIRFNVVRHSPATGKVAKLIASGYFTDSDRGSDLLLAAMSKSNDLLMSALCVQENLLRRMDKILLHIEQITNEEFNGDI